LLSRTRADDDHRAAFGHMGVARRALRARRPAPLGLESAVTIRYAFPDDAAALARLASLDSAEPLAQPALLAEVDGHLRAALSLRDGTLIADPFHHSGALRELLHARALQLFDAHRAATRGRRAQGAAAARTHA
jgi:hypothetical protein